ncbi:MAG: AAA family ATPase [Cyanothece sp. SIO1E1]|nr:AAA family ATPase [Cyanothece sp. SIO1E1]
MSVIAFINQKGGSGKTTTAIHFAYWLAAKQNHQVLLVDADAQQSSSLWLEDMEPQIPYKVLQSPDEILEQLPVLVEQCDYMVVDGPASLSETTRSILFRADLAVVPCQPTGVDLRSASDAVRLIKQAQSVRMGPPKAAVFLSRAVKGTKLKDEATTLLKQTPGVPMLETVIHQKQAIADTSGQSATVWDLGSRPAAESGREYDRLFKEVLAILT